jgi:hypothetical protein
MAFLRFMVALLVDYGEYIIPPTASGNKSLFDKDKFCSFVKSKKGNDEAAFYKCLTSSQSFEEFISKRTLATSDYHAVMFFDSCIDACTERMEMFKDDEWKMPKQSTKRRGSVSVAQVNKVYRPSRTSGEELIFSYSCWPVLSDDLFEMYMESNGRLHTCGGDVSFESYGNNHVSFSTLFCNQCVC